MVELTEHIMALVDKGYLPYAGNVKTRLYEQLGCPFLVFARWFYEGKERLEAECVGCHKFCHVTCDNNFSPHPSKISRMAHKSTWRYTLSANELLEKMRVLTAEQAALCLNVSKSQVYHCSREGKLNPVKIGGCARFKTEEIKQLIDAEEFY